MSQWKNLKFNLTIKNLQLEGKLTGSQQPPDSPTDSENLQFVLTRLCHHNIQSTNKLHHAVFEMAISLLLSRIKNYNSYLPRSISKTTKREYFFYNITTVLCKCTDEKTSFFPFFIQIKIEELNLYHILKCIHITSENAFSAELIFNLWSTKLV
jgi:hypothetical protein